MKGTTSSFSPPHNKNNYVFSFPPTSSLDRRSSPPPSATQTRRRRERKRRGRETEGNRDSRTCGHIIIQDPSVSPAFYILLASSERRSVECGFSHRTHLFCCLHPIPTAILYVRVTSLVPSVPWAVNRPVDDSPPICTPGKEIFHVQKFRNSLSVPLAKVSLLMCCV